MPTHPRYNTTYFLVRLDRSGDAGWRAAVVTKKSGTWSELGEGLTRVWLLFSERREDAIPLVSLVEHVRAPTQHIKCS